MMFQGSGFSVELPQQEVIDASSYAFSFPQVGDLPPNLTIRFESAQGLDIEKRLADERGRILGQFPEVQLYGDEKIGARGDWRYFTHVFDYVVGDLALRQKEMYILVPESKPTLFVISGVDEKENFAQFEPIYDSVVRSFTPNNVQKMA